jgi:hypothetical protein
MTNTFTSAWPPHTLTSDQTTPAQVAAAVMAVLREMAGAAKPPQPSSSQPAGVNSSANIMAIQAEFKANPSVEAFSGSLVLERHAAELGGHVRELVVSPRTVITPLAREILKKKGIATRWAGTSNWPGDIGRKAGEWAVLRIAGDAQSLAVESTLAGRSGEGWDLVGPGLEAALAWQAEKPHRHLAALAEVACITVWRLNQAGLRAAEVRTALEVERVARQFAPHCIVVEPARLPIHESRQIFHTWRRLGVQAEPAGLAVQGGSL